MYGDISWAVKTLQSEGIGSKEPQEINTARPVKSSDSLQTFMVNLEQMEPYRLGLSLSEVRFIAKSPCVYLWDDEEINSRFTWPTTRDPACHETCAAFV